jgi:hypothetical protein
LSVVDEVSLHRFGGYSTAPTLLPAARPQVETSARLTIWLATTSYFARYQLMPSS